MWQWLERREISRLRASPPTVEGRPRPDLAKHGTDLLLQIRHIVVLMTA